MAAHQGPRKISVSRDTFLILTSRKFELMKKADGQVTYDDVVQELLDEVEGTA